MSEKRWQCALLVCLQEVETAYCSDFLAFVMSVVDELLCRHFDQCFEVTSHLDEEGRVV